MIEFIFDEKDIKLSINDNIYFYRADDKILNRYNLNNINDKYADTHVMAIDINKFQNLVKRFNLKVLPTLIFFKNGNEVGRVEDLVI